VKNDKMIAIRLDEATAADLQTIIDWLHKLAPGDNQNQSHAVRYAIITAAAEIRMQAGETK